MELQGNDERGRPAKALQQVVEDDEARPWVAAESNDNKGESAWACCPLGDGISVASEANSLMTKAQRSTGRTSLSSVLILPSALRWYTKLRTGASQAREGPLISCPTTLNTRAVILCRTSRSALWCAMARMIVHC